jgi:hypothetical protein
MTSCLYRCAQCGQPVRTKFRNGPYGARPVRVPFAHQSPYGFACSGSEREAVPIEEKRNVRG